MSPIDRNPDIDLATEAVPNGMTMIEGKNLMHTARCCKVPFGVASRRINGECRPRTIGIIIRDHDVIRFQDALAKKNERKSKWTLPIEP